MCPMFLFFFRFGLDEDFLWGGERDADEFFTTYRKRARLLPANSKLVGWTGGRDFVRVCG